MNIKQKLALIKIILYFNDILRKGKISKSAEENGIKQSNLSRLITDFEKASGVTLLQRSNQGVIPTPQGMRISQLRYDAYPLFFRFYKIWKNWKKSSVLRTAEK